MSDGNVKLLMFSDIEGCQKWNLAGPKKGTFEQSGFLCDPAFYTEMKKRLVDDENLSIAFLGDYFDQGMGVYDSINGLNKLLTEFNKNGKERVFVILGNRDVNKLRFCFELAKKDTVVGIPDGQNRWKLWGNFHDHLGEKKDNEVALVNHILFESMGAKIDMETFHTNGKPEAKLVGLHSFLPSSLSEEQKQDSQLALKYLKVALGIEPRGDDTQDALDLLDFFSKCKLAHLFDGPGGKVLLAHGGGFDSDAFFDQPYVYSFEKTEAVTGKNYHIMLEEFRRKLSLTVQSGGDREAAQRYGDDQSKRNKYLRKQVPYSVDVYNTLLRDVLKEIRLVQFTWKFVLLQALGLKPDDEDARYKSLIQSCSQEGCNGPNKELSSDKGGTKLAKILKDSGITHVSYGHKPVCFPIPLIYQRSTIKGVTFISNDTSNGNRKTKNIGDNTVVGTSITFKSDNSVETQVELVTLDGKDSPASDYSDMFGPFSLEIPPPEYLEEDGKETTLTYKGRKISFNNLLKPPASFGELRFDAITPPPVPEAQAVVGGRRRSRNRKRNTKRVSRYISKRTRRNKKTMRGRKTRKY